MKKSLHLLGIQALIAVGAGGLVALGYVIAMDDVGIVPWQYKAIAGVMGFISMCMMPYAGRLIVEEGFV